MQWNNPYTSQGIRADSRWVDWALGKTASGIGSALYNTSAAVGSAAINVASKVGSAAITAAPHIGSAVINAAEWVGGGAIEAVRPKNLKILGKNAQNVGDKFIEYEPQRTVWNRAEGRLETRGGGPKFTKLAWAGLIGAGLIGSAIAGSDRVDTEQMGVVDSRATSLSPNYAANLQDGYYSKRPPTRFDNANATGDLVFALHKLR